MANDGSTGVGGLCPKDGGPTFLEAPAGAGSEGFKPSAGAGEGNRHGQAPRQDGVTTDKAVDCRKDNFGNGNEGIPKPY